MSYEIMLNIVLLLVKPCPEKTIVCYRLDTDSECVVI
jgi:hypothetical protein